MDSGYELPFQEAAIKELLPHYRHQTMLKYLENDVTDRAMGCLFGSFIGDALGSYLQFAKEKDYDKLMSNVMDMPGGGVFKLKPGQITDDSELAFHLLNALANFEPQDRFEEKADNLLITIANEYLNWFESHPFDIGITCRKGLAEIATLFYVNKIDRSTKQFAFEPAIAKSIAQQIKESVYSVSKDSQSNGSLMRLAPMPFYFGLVNKASEDGMLNRALGLSMAGMKDFIKKETELLHPNEVVVDVCSLWSRMLISLIKRKSNQEIIGIYDHLKKQMESEKIGWGNFLSSPYPISAKKQHIGWSKIAVTLGFESLRSITGMKNMTFNEQTYSGYIKDVLSRGGDTDTNAAIVGGMLGAIVGFKNLPKKYLKKMMAVRFDALESAKRTNRPKFYEPRKAYANAFTIIQKVLKELL